MNISSIQKRKFLGNIYKILYSQGKKPSELEIKKVFGEYFSVYKNIKTVLINKCTDLSPFLYIIIFWLPKILIGGK